MPNKQKGVLDNFVMLYKPLIDAIYIFITAHKWKINQNAKINLFLSFYKNGKTFPVLVCILCHKRFYFS